MGFNGWKGGGEGGIFHSGLGLWAEQSSLNCNGPTLGYAKGCHFNALLSRRVCRRSKSYSASFEPLFLPELYHGYWPGTSLGVIDISYFRWDRGTFTPAESNDGNETSSHRVMASHNRKALLCEPSQLICR